MRPKYNKVGGFSTKSFAKHGIPSKLVMTLVEAANHSLASNTHRSYKTAINHIRRVEQYTGKKLTFPFTVKSTLTYVAYLIQECKIAASSLEKNLSVIHMSKLENNVYEE